MDIRDVAFWIVFALICAVPALLISRHIWLRVAVFLACATAGLVLPVLAILAGIAGNALVAIALLVPVLVTLVALLRRGPRARLVAEAGGATLLAAIGYVIVAWSMTHAQDPLDGAMHLPTYARAVSAVREAAGGSADLKLEQLTMSADQHHRLVCGRLRNASGPTRAFVVEVKPSKAEARLVDEKQANAASLVANECEEREAPRVSIKYMGVGGSERR